MQQFLLAALTAGVEGGAGTGMMAQFLPLILIFVVFYLMLIRPQKKREKQVQEMRAQIEVGDEIITTGGIIGTVVVVKEEYLVIETGSDRSKIRIVKQAVQSNETKREAVAAAQAAQQQARAESGSGGLLGGLFRKKSNKVEPEAPAGPDIK